MSFLFSYTSPELDIFRLDVPSFFRGGQLLQPLIFFAVATIASYLSCRFSCQFLPSSLLHCFLSYFPLYFLKVLMSSLLSPKNRFRKPAPYTQMLVIFFSCNFCVANFFGNFCRCLRSGALFSNYFWVLIKTAENAKHQRGSVYSD